MERGISEFAGEVGDVLESRRVGDAWYTNNNILPVHWIFA